MTLFRATIKLHTAFGTPLAGDTLFGQLCWTAREHLGDAALGRLLEGYTEGRPWLVVSDGFPSGHLPKPALPHLRPSLQHERKAEKARRWIALSQTGNPVAKMAAVDDDVAYGKGCSPVEAPQPHNTLNRLTGTTGAESFAPYTQMQIFFARAQKIDLYFVLDEARMSVETLRALLQAVGSFGFGRDASIGLGKFTVVALEKFSFEQHPEANAYWTLAPCSPYGGEFDGERSYWRVITRFGRHGNLHGLSGKPFKNPILLAATSAVFVPRENYTRRQFIGQGLGGNGQLSKAEPATVHQGYAPVVGVRMGA